MGENLFKGKKVVIMGLGLLGGALNDAIYLAKQGAELTVTDLKNEDELKEPVLKLKNLKTLKPITFNLGGHRLSDFKQADFILQPGNVPLDSPYLAEARKNNIPVYVSESLFAKYSSGIIVGVTGTRGKSTTAHMIYDCLKKFPPKGSKVFLGGNVKNVSTLSLLEEVKEGDVVVLELDSWALHGMGEIKKSPNIAIFTTFFDDHLNYYKNDRNLYLEDKANIFKFQETKEFLILGEQVEKIIIEKYRKIINSRIIIARSANLPKNLNLQVIGEHNRYNASCAFEALKLLGLTDVNIKTSLEGFKGVSGRLEFVKDLNGVKIYNDTTSTTPEATIVALRALSESGFKNQEPGIILIMGGSDKGLDMSELVLEIPRYCKKVILLPGTGTEKLLASSLELSGQKILTAKSEQLKAEVADSLQEAVAIAVQGAVSGDVILFSPAFASFGMFKNEFDRGEKFLEEIKKL